MRQPGETRYYVYKVFEPNGSFWRYEPAQEGWEEKHPEYQKIPEKFYLLFDEASFEAIRMNEAEMAEARRKLPVRKLQ